MSFNREIDDVVETLRQAKGRGKTCTVLIGAGCSVSAGIPTAAMFVDIIKNEYPRSYKLAKDKTYPQCMAQLSIGERRDLIAKHIDNAKINWAHIGSAQLIKYGYVDGVLTTNFDQLVMKAGAMVGIFPAAYDFAASQLFKSADVPDQAIFYLHGQRTGFVLMNTAEECENHSKLLAPVFDDAGKKRVWLVVGYSGECDPVFEHLAKVDRFDNKLYWVGYGDKEPDKHILERLMKPENDAYYVKGFDADDFFINLAQRLECFPPDFVGRPFSHLDTTLDMLTKFPVPNQESDLDIVDGARRNIREAIGRYERPDTASTSNVDGDKGSKDKVSLEATALFSAGKYAEVIKLAGDLTPPFQGVAVDPLYWSLLEEGNRSCLLARSVGESEAFDAYSAAIKRYAEAISVKPEGHEAHNNWGNALSAHAKTKSGDEADRLFSESYGRYAEAVRIKPDYHGAFYNWGLALSAQAKTKSGEEADRLFSESHGRYAEAVRIKPDYHEALNNWGITIWDQAQTKSGEQADRLFSESCGRYADVLRIKPDSCEAFNNWGNALSSQAQTKYGEEANRLFTESYDKYAEAVRLKPDYHLALNNWGNALSFQAKTKSGDEAGRLFSESCGKYAEAVLIKPDYYQALNNWGSTLLDHSNMKSGDDADHLFFESCGRYAEAVHIKPDYHEAFNNWGIALSAQAKTKSGEEADRLLSESCGKYAEAVRIKPDYHEALTNWGNALIAQAQLKSGGEADRLLSESSGRYAEAVRIKPDYHVAFNNWGIALFAQARTKSGDEADRLFSESYSRYAEAVRIKPDYYEAFNLWGNTISAQAKTKSGEEADRLFSESCGRYAEAVRIKPDFHEALNNWGSTLLFQAQKKTGSEKESILVAAEEKLHETERLEPGVGSYNLACVYSLSGREKECLEHLERSFEMGKLPDLDHLQTDNDLDSVRDTQWYKEFVERVTAGKNVLHAEKPEPDPASS